MAEPVLTKRFKSALAYAFELHNNQVRKGGHVPYLAHLLAVSALVLEDGGDEDQAIAALLHDAVEDQGGKETLHIIRERYGERVAEIVSGCTDADIMPKPPWRQRKEAYLRHLASASPEIRRVSLADKLHNARSLVEDLRYEGEIIWDRFNGGKEGTLWYYRKLVDIFSRYEETWMYDEFQHTVSEIERLADKFSGRLESVIKDRCAHAE